MPKAPSCCRPASAAIRIFGTGPTIHQPAHRYLNFMHDYRIYKHTVRLFAARRKASLAAKREEREFAQDVKLERADETWRALRSSPYPEDQAARTVF